jgi:dual oxidase
LPRLKEWTEINPSLFKKRPKLLGLLAAVYANRLDNVDLYVGGMLESRDGPGELFRAIIKEQFTRIRDADRFWLENTENG